jgi:hypothetical protein
MNTTDFSLHRKGAFIGLILLSILLFSACKVTFVPEYDAELSSQIDETAKMVDRFYLEMLETTSNQNGGRAFEGFVQGYIDVEVELNSLFNRNKIRPLNENSTRICEITLQLWAKYKEEHKTDNALSDGLIKLNRQTFSDLFYAMQVAEKAKEIVNNPPE